jgi:hypothetical protein
MCVPALLTLTLATFPIGTTEFAVQGQRPDPQKKRKGESRAEERYRPAPCVKDKTAARAISDCFEVVFSAKPDCTCFRLSNEAKRGFPLGDLPLCRLL